MKILIAVSVYIIGVIITTLICYKLDTDDEDVIGIAWFWPFAICMLVVFGMISLPVGIYKLLDNKSGDVENKNSYYDGYNWEDEDE